MPPPPFQMLLSASGKSWSGEYPGEYPEGNLTDHLLLYFCSCMQTRYQAVFPRDIENCLHHQKWNPYKAVATLQLVKIMLM